MSKTELKVVVGVCLLAMITAAGVFVLNKSNDDIKNYMTTFSSADKQDLIPPIPDPIPPATRNQAIGHIHTNDIDGLTVIGSVLDRVVLYDMFPEEVRQHALSTNIFWSWGDGLSNTQKGEIQHTYAIPDEYPVKLIVTVAFRGGVEKIIQGECYVIVEPASITNADFRVAKNDISASLPASCVSISSTSDGAVATMHSEPPTDTTLFSISENPIITYSVWNTSSNDFWISLKKLNDVDGLWSVTPSAVFVKSGAEATGIPVNFSLEFDLFSCPPAGEYPLNVKVSARPQSNVWYLTYKPSI